MKNVLIKLIVNIISFTFVVKLVSGIQVDNWKTVIIVGIVLTFVNAFLKPSILLFTLPLNILSLGLFTFVINGFMFYIVSKIVKGFYVVNFWNAVIGALIFSITGAILNIFISPSHGKVKFGFHRPADFRKNKYHDVIDVEAKEENRQQGLEKQG
ncbi:MAG: phage holin family protein [Elusimicrobia bacterium]|nr:phage holin family protein [Elusimicrobiota bacterium]